MRIAFQVFIILQLFTQEICYFLKVYFLTVSFVFSVYKRSFKAQ